MISILVNLAKKEEVNKSENIVYCDYWYVFNYYATDFCSNTDFYL